MYFFYITNDWVSEPAEIVFCANERCDQENLLAQLGGGVRACAPRSIIWRSNWAYMVMTALAWNLKAWWALMLPELPGRYQEKHRAEKRWVLRLEFKTFVNAFVRLALPDRPWRPPVGSIACWGGIRTSRSSSAWWMCCSADAGIHEVGVRMLRSPTAP